MRNGADPVQGSQRSGLVVTCPKRLLHLGTDTPPVSSRHMPGKAPIRHDLDFTLRQQHVEQHTIILSGVPHAQQREYFDCPRCTADTTPQVTYRKHRFHGAANFRAMRLFRSRAGRIDGGQRRRGETPP
jgi:hypothetical protein